MLWIAGMFVLVTVVCGRAWMRLLRSECLSSSFSRCSERSPRMSLLRSWPGDDPMPTRGEPFDPKKGGKKRLVLFCPVCGDVLVPKVVVAVGASDTHAGSTPLDPPYYRYQCQNSPRCDYCEVQGHMLLAEEDHP